MRKIKISADEFAAKVNEAYSGRITIVKETYTGAKNPVTAYCNIHEIYFEVKEARNLTRLGQNQKKFADCPKCIEEKRQKINKQKIKPWSEVLKSFKEIYGDKFSYDESSYIDTKHKIKIHCNDCGADFEMLIQNHLKDNNGGCPNCSKTRIGKCSKCGKEIIVDRHIDTNRTTCYCDDCRKWYSLISKAKFYHKDQCENLSDEEIYEQFSHCKICGELLNDNLKCDNKFCNEHHILTFKTLIKYFNFDENKLGTTEVEKEFNRVRDMLYDMYWNKHMSSGQICDFFNYPDVSHLTNNVFLRLDIPVKSISESLQDAIYNGVKVYNSIESYKYKQTHHTTWDNKIVFLRSSYEEDYANYLDENKILYEVESIRLRYFDSQKNKERIAIPDFYLPDTNMIVEIKSSWTLDVINMLDKVKIYKESGFNFKLILEHKEVNIYDLINVPQYKSPKRNRFSLVRTWKTTVKNKKWKWMNNGSENYKVPIDEIDNYVSKGFVFGCLINNNKRDVL